MALDRCELPGTRTRQSSDHFLLSAVNRCAAREDACRLVLALSLYPDVDHSVKEPFRV
jgi:hypothetical protein